MWGSALRYLVVDSVKSAFIADILQQSASDDRPLIRVNRVMAMRHFESSSASMIEHILLTQLVLSLLQIRQENRVGVILCLYKSWRV